MMCVGVIGSDLLAVNSGQKYFHLISRISFSEARIKVQMPETNKRVSETMSDEFDLVSLVRLLLIGQPIRINLLHHASP